MRIDHLPGPLTTKAFAALPTSVEVGGAGGSSLLDSLAAQDASLRRLHLSEWPPKTPARFIQPHAAKARPPASGATVATVDVAVCGGTLGLLLACALQRQGHRVAVIEAGPLRGRAQDWNTSEEELRQLVAAGVLDASELAEVAPLSFGPMACRFGGPPREGRFELQLRGVLDVGVSPTALLERVRTRFEQAGGLVLERTPVRGVSVFADGVELSLRQTPPPATDDDDGGGSDASDGATTDATLHARLVVDCMGHRSPIALQQRAGQTPDGVCVQVGSCARGAWPARAREGAGDFFVTADDAVERGPNRRARVQYFWQAFPSSGGADERSSYLFTYLRPGPEMPSLLEVMEDYWQAMPAYQQLGGTAGGGNDGDAEEAAEAAAALEGLDVRRIVFGWFPTYRRNAPLAPSFDRVLSVGDASAVQSPISFGGFCAMLRHLPRYSRGIDLALRSDRLTASDLRLMTPYLPNLATAWMSSAAMTARALPAAAVPANDAGRDDGTGDGDGDGDGDSRGGEAPYTLVNELLSGNFEVMAGLARPDAILFFRDVTTLATLAAVLVGQTATMAPLLPRVVAELVGPLELAEFGVHLTMLATYTALHRVATLARARDALPTAAGERAATDERDGGAYALSCALDALAFGSGLDGEPSSLPSPPPPPSSNDGAADAAAAAAAVQQRQRAQGGDGDGDGDDESRPWWRRPPPTWPPRIDDPSLVVGDVFAAYFAAYASVGVLTTGRDDAWQQEGAVLATSWIVAAAVTNGWDPTSVIPSLGLPNALRCVARMGIDAASTRVLLGLMGAALARQQVDAKLLALELALSAAALASWRCLYTLNNPDRR